MHEMSIASSVLDAVRREMARRPGERACQVALRVGVMAAVDAESLRFCFEALVRGTDLEPLGLEIELCPRRHRCPECRHEFAVEEYEVRCPACGCAVTECIGGDELDLAYLEVEEPEPTAVAAQSAE
jgi:hydrogenase nickel incorporation protein HypA/HybF